MVDVGVWSLMSDNQKWCPDAAFGTRCVLPLDHEPDTHYYARDAAKRYGWDESMIRPETAKDWGKPFDAQPSRCPRTGGPGETRCILARGHTTVCAWDAVELVAKPLPLAEPRCGLLLTDPEPDGPFTCELDDNHAGACSGDRVVPQFPGPETMEHIVTELNKTFGPVEVPLTAEELREQSEDRAERIHRLEQALHADKQSLAQVGETNRVLRRQLEELQSALKKAQDESGNLSERNVALAKRNMQMEQELSKTQDALNKVNAHYAAVDAASEAHDCPTADHTECRLLASRLRRALNALLDDD